MSMTLAVIMLAQPNQHKGREMATLWIQAYTIQHKTLPGEVLTDSDSSNI